MKPQKQAFLHNPPETYGDCFRTALACILDMDRDEVPHFFNCDDSESTWDPVNEWLLLRGLSLFSIPFNSTLEELMDFMDKINPGTYYLLCGKSPRGLSHQVVALNKKIVCDPAQQGGGLIGPCPEDDLYWVNVLLPHIIHKEKAGE